MISRAGCSRISNGREVSLAASSGNSSTWVSIPRNKKGLFVRQWKEIKGGTDSMDWKAEAPVLDSRVWIIARANWEFLVMFASFKALLTDLVISLEYSPSITKTGAQGFYLLIDEKIFWVRWLLKARRMFWPEPLDGLGLPDKNRYFSRRSQKQVVVA